MTSILAMCLPSKIQRADALAVLGLHWSCQLIPLIVLRWLLVIFCVKYGLRVSEVHITLTNFEPRDCRFSIIDHALHGILPDDPNDAASIRRISPRSTIRQW